MKDTLRWGLIGCGDISKKRVAPALKSLENCELLAVARANHQRAASFAREFGAARWYANWEELVADKDLDAVYIATPVYLHAEQTIAAAKAGKHVLCEKPMALNAGDSNRMIDACKDHEVTLGIAYYRHFYPVIRRIGEIINSGEIGDPVTAGIQVFEWFDRKPGEPRYWLLEKEKSGGGPMMDFGCHRIEVLQHLFGNAGKVQSGLYNLHFNREVEDTAWVSLYFEDKVHALITVSHAAGEPRDSLDVYCTRGSIHVPVLNEELMLVRTEKGERTEHHPPHTNVHLPLIEDFTKAVLNETNPVVDGVAGKAVTSILDEIYR